MSGDTVIRAERLGKKYLIGHRSSERHTTLRETVGRATARLGRGVGDMLRGRQVIGGDETEEFWALKDVAFEIRRGDVVGIVGRNGAGKSTLLKILSRITEPTEGRVEIRGRVASLLEVGTGFHPELTGRENIYLNGAILGMTRAEIARRFDEIVDFAGVEKFLDTPVKRYSSGMYVRLAFSVAAHLEPEILVVDEVLAVGDAEFQKKCLGKMENVASRENRTVLFVSHQMEAISEICDRAILLEDGKIATEGPTSAVIEAYLAQRHRGGPAPSHQSSCGRFSLKHPYWVDSQGRAVTGFEFGADIRLRFEFEFASPVRSVNPGIRLIDMWGRTVFISHLADAENFRAPSAYRGTVVLETEFNLPLLAPGHYELDFGVRDENENTVIYSERNLAFEVIPPGFRKNGAAGVLWHTTNWRIAGPSRSSQDD